METFFIASIAKTMRDLRGNVAHSRVKCALCVYVIRLRVSYNQTDETLSRNSLRYLSKASLPMAVH